MMELRKALVTALAGCTLGFASGGAMAVDCSTIGTIGAWSAAGSCDQDDKTWTFTGTDLDGGILVLFGNPGGGATHSMQIIGFDTSNAADTWFIDYTITVTDPTKFIDAMFAEADNPGGGSDLTKTVTGDAAFVLSVIDGVGDSALGLVATTLDVHEVFSVDADADLLSVSNSYRQKMRVAEPGTLALMGIALAGVALIRRRRN